MARWQDHVDRSNRATDHTFADTGEKGLGGQQRNYTSTTTVTGGPTGRSVKTYWYTVTDGTKYYVAKITSNMFNVTTPAKVDVGDAKFAVDGKNLILKGSDGKEYKTEIVRTSLTPPTQPLDPGPPIIQDDRPI